MAGACPGGKETDASFGRRPLGLEVVRPCLAWRLAPPFPLAAAYLRAAIDFSARSTSSRRSASSIFIDRLAGRHEFGVLAGVQAVDGDAVAGDFLQQRRVRA